jgi:hypothetical protein
MGELVAAPPAKSGTRKTYSCNFCQAPVGHDAAVKRAPTPCRGYGRDSADYFCSDRCLHCVRALEALHPSPLAPHEFRLARGVLTDQLLALWRSGKGPDPEIVFQAAERAARQTANR